MIPEEQDTSLGVGTRVVSPAEAGSGGNRDLIGTTTEVAPCYKALRDVDWRLLWRREQRSDLRKKQRSVIARETGQRCCVRDWVLLGDKQGALAQETGQAGLPAHQKDEGFSYMP